MIECTLSFHNGDKVSEKHDRREKDKNGNPYFSKNVHPELSDENIYYEKNRTIQEFYDDEFEEAYREYIEKVKKKNPQRVKDCEQSYLKELTKKQRLGELEKEDLIKRKAHIKDISKADRYVRPVKQLIVQLGDNGSEFRVLGGTEKERSKEILKEYMDTFEERNPGMKVVSAAIHCDEWDIDKDGKQVSGTVHLHLTYCPVVESGRGQRIQNSMNAAFKMQGLETDKEQGAQTGEFKTAQMKWQERQREYLKELSLKKGISIQDRHDKRHSESVQEYQARKDAERALEARKSDLEALQSTLDNKALVIEQREHNVQKSAEENNKKSAEISERKKAVDDECEAKCEATDRYVNSTENAVNDVIEAIDELKEKTGQVGKSIDEYPELKLKKGYRAVPEADLVLMCANSWSKSEELKSGVNKIISALMNIPTIRRLSNFISKLQQKCNETESRLYMSEKKVAQLEDEIENLEYFKSEVLKRDPDLYEEIYSEPEEEQEIGD